MFIIHTIGFGWYNPINDIIKHNKDNINTIIGIINFSIFLLFLSQIEFNVFV